MPPPKRFKGMMCTLYQNTGSEIQTAVLPAIAANADETSPVCCKSDAGHKLTVAADACQAVPTVEVKQPDALVKGARCRVDACGINVHLSDRQSGVKLQAEMSLYSV